MKTGQATNTEHEAPRRVTIRPVTPADRSELGTIAYETAFFGKSAEVFFPSRKLFTELWIDPYLGPAGCCCFIVELGGRAVGYIVGTCDISAYQRHLATLTPGLLWRMLNGAYRDARGSVRYLWRMLRFSGTPAPVADFPAQLHMNLLPGARGEGAGNLLLETHLNCLRQRGVPGVQLSTTSLNSAALHLYGKFGFAVHAEYESSLWRPWLGRSITHVLMTKKL